MFSRNEDILQAIIDGTDISEMQPPQSREEALLLGILDKINKGGGGAGKEFIHICTSEEYNQITGVPTVSNPSDSTLYLVPASSATTGNLFDEWVYANSAWEHVGSVNVNVPVKDVRVNGISIINNQGVALIPIASSNQFGLVQPGDGINNNNGIITPYYARSASIKAGVINYDVIVPSNQHESTFYGLAKAAGDSSQSQSNKSIGDYTNVAKSAIAQMLCGSVAISGTTPTITALPGIRYICGEVSTITITPPASGIVNVVFESGTTPTVLTLPQTVVMPEWFDSTDLEANRVYEISIADGVYGVVTSWPA